MLLCNSIQMRFVREQENRQETSALQGRCRYYRRASVLAQKRAKKRREKQQAHIPKLTTLMYSAPQGKNGAVAIKAPSANNRSPDPITLRSRSGRNTEYAEAIFWSSMALESCRSGQPPPPSCLVRPTLFFVILCFRVRSRNNLDRHGVKSGVLTFQSATGSLQGFVVLRKDVQFVRLSCLSFLLKFLVFR